MTQESTNRKLANMTDEGLFERLATAVLRLSEDRFRAISHPGVNADGKTVKSPVDGIAFVSGAIPPQMIIVHHTICAAKDLEKKWLHDPATVKPRSKKNLPTAPAGDIIKTIAIVAAERMRTPDVQTILILTTNQEPGQALVRDVHATGVAAGIAINIWSRSRLADFLDNEPRGQWLRSKFLEIEQVQLSEEMLSELSSKNLELFSLPDRPERWVERALDHEIEAAAEVKVVFVIAESGSGKSVACYKRLMSNKAAGGFSFILTDEVISLSLSLEQAIEKSLAQLHPSLVSGCGSAALHLASPARRLLLTVEDINKSGRGAALIEKIVRWQGDKSKQDSAISWQMLCPVWPQVMASLDDDVRKRINSQAIVGSVFSAKEGAEAVETRLALEDRSMTKLEATKISESLGHDPLLIALYDPANAPDPSQTIAQFIEGRLQKLSVVRGEFSAAEYGKALSDLAISILLNRQIEPSSTNLLTWPSLSDHVTALRHLVQQKDVIRFTGPSTAEKLAFRHDRVREWLLARAAFELMSEKMLPDNIAAEPYFAEIFGLALARQEATSGHVSLMAANNPLALVCSLLHFSATTSPNQTAIVTALNSWLSIPTSKERGHRHLSWEARRSLSGAEGPDIIPLVAKFDDNSWNALRARYRNGDIMGGIGLCLQIEPGVGVVGHEEFLDHVKTRLGVNLINILVMLLTHAKLDERTLIGALRLAGHIGEPSLANALRGCWHTHGNRNEHLDEYLWACAQCIDDDPVSLLGPVCDGWAALPNTKEISGIPSLRDNLAADHLRWAFRKRLPYRAIRYFIERATGPELKWPITYMLHGLDQPDAVEFVVRELAATDERLEGTKGFSSFSLSATRDWERIQEEKGRAMSDASRKRLQDLWQDQSTGKHLRKQAFRIWASTRHISDLEPLRSLPEMDALADSVLWQRLRRGDGSAIPGLVEKLSKDGSGYWWQLGRYIWSDELTKELDAALERRNAPHSAAGPDESESENPDWILSEMLMRLPIRDANKIMIKHWNQLCTSHYYVVAALYVATPDLQARVAATMKAASDPKELIKHLAMRFGYKQSGHPGLYRREQIKAVLPYLDLLEEMDIYDLWNACNEHEWFDLRRAHLDSRLSSKWRDWIYLDDTRFMNALDEFLTKKDSWLNHRIDEFLKSGASVDHVMTIVGRWLLEKRNLQALELASGAVLHIGERRHIELLRAAKVEPAEQADAIIADTEFGVKRRTLRV